MLFAGSVNFPVFHDRKLDKLENVCYFILLLKTTDLTVRRSNDSRITDTLTV